MTLIVLTGIQGSGKSEFCIKNFTKIDIVRINLDNLKSRIKEDALIKNCIIKNKSLIIDNINVTVLQRKKYIDLAKENNYKVISYYIKCEIDVAIARNKLREGFAHVPNFVIYTTCKNLVIPSKEEGFDALYVVNNSKNIE